MRHHFVLILTTLLGLAAAQDPANTPPSGATTPGAATATSPDDGNRRLQTPAVRLDREGQTVLSPRIRNVTRLANCMPYLVTGVGLVTGLSGTGSSDRGTRQAIINFIKQHDLNLTIADVIGGSTALVSLTCEIPPFAKEGIELDVKVEVLGDATSLRGGDLLFSQLKGVDGQAHVVAQGPLLVSGFNAQGQNAGVKQNTPTIAWLDNGGIVIREQKTSYFSESGSLELHVLNPSPYNSSSIAGGIAAALDGTDARVKAVDATLVRIDLPEQDRTAENANRILALVGNVRVAVENPARVLIDQASGTILAGEGVLISPCVVGISDLTIAIVEEDYVSQPNPLSDGTTERVGRTRVEAETNNSELGTLGGGATVSDLLQNLKTLGLTPQQLVSVFQALEGGGFLHATLEVR